MAKLKQSRRFIIGSGKDKSVYVFDKNTGLLVRENIKNNYGCNKKNSAIKFFASPLIISK